MSILHLEMQISKLMRRIEALEEFLDNHFNYRNWNEDTKNPTPVKEVGDDESKNVSLRNLAARESIGRIVKCSLCRRPHYEDEVCCIAL